MGEFLSRSGTFTVYAKHHWHLMWPSILNEGEGGESNPCFKPIYDETIRAPVRHNVGLTGEITEDKGVIQVAEGQRTIGPARNFLRENDATEDSQAGESGSSGNALVDMFRPPSDR